MSDSTEAVIQRTIQGIQKMIRVHEPEEGGDKEEPGIPVSLAMKRHFESEIRTLKDAPRDEMKLRQILKVKQKEYEKTAEWEDIERLFSD